MRTASVGSGLTRGVYVAPWMGPNGEIVLIAVTRERKLAGDPVTVPHGTSHLLAGDELWARLERADPLPCLKIL